MKDRQIKIDYKKQDKDLYLPSVNPTIVKVPKMNFVAVRGQGDPNDENGEYQKALPLLYGISYTIKMSKKQGDELKNYHDYTIPPLEGFWSIDLEQITDFGISDKSKFSWTSMIRLPEFVSEEVFEWAKKKLAKKKPELDALKALYLQFDEGECAQVMHLGSYDEELKTIKQLHQFISSQGFVEDFNSNCYREHHEIYLNDPRKVPPEKLKTIIRHPIKKSSSEQIIAFKL